mmetsp:Transcript_1944/g.7732  ORF Transcript_1944/g.7732 Transcript_1944/m.7732 type:complete len:465 (+) Transcript_1944:125-1519(+)
MCMMYSRRFAFVTKLFQTLSNLRRQNNRERFPPRAELGRRSLRVGASWERHRELVLRRTQRKRSLARVQIHGRHTPPKLGQTHDDLHGRVGGGRHRVLRNALRGIPTRRDSFVSRLFRHALQFRRIQTRLARPRPARRLFLRVADANLPLSPRLRAFRVHAGRGRVEPPGLRVLPSDALKVLAAKRPRVNHVAVFPDVLRDVPQRVVLLAGLGYALRGALGVELSAEPRSGRQEPFLDGFLGVLRRGPRGGLGGGRGSGRGGVCRTRRRLILLGARRVVLLVREHGKRVRVVLVLAVGPFVPRHLHHDVPPGRQDDAVVLGDVLRRNVHEVVPEVLLRHGLAAGQRPAHDAGVKQHVHRGRVVAVRVQHVPRGPHQHGHARVAQPPGVQMLLGHGHEVGAAHGIDAGVAAHVHEHLTARLDPTRALALEAEPRLGDEHHCPGRCPHLDWRDERSPNTHRLRVNE